MATQPPPGGQAPQTPRAPSPTSLLVAKSCSYKRKSIVLVNWWLERRGDKICVAGQTETLKMKKEPYSSVANTNSASRLFKGAITKWRDYSKVETENGNLIWVKGTLDTSRMRENGFSEQVCKFFMDGFPKDWKELLDSSMEHRDEHPQSPLNSTDDDDAFEQYMAKFNSDCLVNKQCSFAEHFSYFAKHESSDLGKPETSKCFKTSVNLGTDNTSKVPAAGMTPQSGAVRASEKNEAMALRSGRALGRPISAPVIIGNKRKRAQHKASDNKNLSNESVSPPADLTSHENGRSVSGIDANDKVQAHDSHCKGTSKPAKKKHSRSETKRRLDSKRLFSKFM